MLAAKTPTIPPTHHQKPEGRRALQPRIANIIPVSDSTLKPRKENYAPISFFTSSNKENNPGFALTPIDASLAEELTAVRHKLERLRLDRERTEKMLHDRTRLLDFQMIEMEQRGEVQKELEIEVDRLYRLNQLKLACMRRSPIRSLREKEMEKKNKDAQFEGSKIRERRHEKLFDESSTSESLTMSSVSRSASTSASTSNSTSTLRKSPIPLRWSLESVSSDE